MKSSLISILYTLLSVSEALVVPPQSMVSKLRSSRNIHNNPHPHPHYHSPRGYVLFMTNNDNNQSSSSSSEKKDIHTRKSFFQQTLTSTFTLTSTLLTPLLLPPTPTYAFDGGVGGLGKTKPSTGVTFINPEDQENVINTITPGDFNTELLAPDGTTPVFVSFYAPWSMLKSSGVESRDLSNSESAFVQVVPNKSQKDGNSGGVVDTGNLPKRFFVESIFGSEGKYGMYGTPTDIKVSKLPSSSSSSSDNNDTNHYLYMVTFTTLTPAMRESDRKAYISVSSSVIGDGIFMLVAGTTVNRFKSQEGLLKKVVDSFVCVEAPKSSFRRQQQ